MIDDETEAEYFLATEGAAIEAEEAMTLPVRLDGRIDRHHKRARKFMCSASAEPSSPNETALGAAIKALANEFREHAARERERCAQEVREAHRRGDDPIAAIRKMCNMDEKFVERVVEAIELCPTPYSSGALARVAIAECEKAGAERIAKLEAEVAAMRNVFGNRKIP